jgi:hypothetical protein
MRQGSFLVIGTLLLTAIAADVASAESDKVADLRPGRAFPAVDEFRIGAMEPVDGPGRDKEGSPDINLEFLLGRFGPQYQNAFWNHFLRPRLAVPSAPMAAQTLPMQV